MDKYIVWTSLHTGEYVRADRVEEVDNKVLFIQTRGVVEVIVREFIKTDKLEYHEVK